MDDGRMHMSPNNSANFLYVLHLFFGVVLMISSYWKR